MPSKSSKKKPEAALPIIPKELIDQFVSGPMTAEAVNSASMEFKKALIERVLSAELSHHLGYLPGAEKPGDTANHRNGASGKTVLTDDGPLKIDVPRDRADSFEPVLIPKHARRFKRYEPQGQGQLADIDRQRTGHRHTRTLRDRKQASLDVRRDDEGRRKPVTQRPYATESLVPAQDRPQYHPRRTSASTQDELAPATKKRGLR